MIDYRSAGRLRPRRVYLLSSLGGAPTVTRTIQAGRTVLTRRKILSTAVVSGTAALLGACGKRASTATGGGAGGQGSGQRAAGAGTVVTFPPDARKAPDPISGELLDGTPFALQDWRGKVIVVNFWGSWCAPCRLEARDLEAAYQATRDLDVRFLGVDIRDGRDAAKSFVVEFGITYPSLFDPPGRVALAFKDVPPNVVPATVLLDRKGRVAAVYRRVVTRTELEAALRALAAEAA